MVFHTAPKSKKEATERLTILMRGSTRPQLGPASNRQDTRHSRLQTMLDAEQPDKLLAHLSRRTDDRREPHPPSFIRHRNQLLSMSAPFDIPSHAEERPADLAERLGAIPMDRILAAAPRPRTWSGLRALPYSLSQIGGMGRDHT